MRRETAREASLPGLVSFWRTRTPISPSEPTRACVTLAPTANEEVHRAW